MRRVATALVAVLVAGACSQEAVEEITTTSVATTTTAAPTTTTVGTTTSTSTTTIPASALDGIVLYTADDCYRCDFLESRLGDLAGEVPVWVRPAEEGMVRLPVVVVQYGGDVAGRWEGQVAVNSAEAIASFAGERWAGWEAAALGITTTTTLPLWASTAEWCDEDALPGIAVGDEVITVEGNSPTYEGQTWVRAYIFVRVLEYVGYETALTPEQEAEWVALVGERTGSVITELDTGFPVIRASVLERDSEVFEAEFVVGDLESVGPDSSHVTLTPGVGLVLLEGRRVPFDDCPGGGETTRGSGPVLFREVDLEGEVLRVGRVYPVAMWIEFPGCSDPADLMCAWRAARWEYNGELVDYLRSGDLAGLASLPGRGRIEQVFIPDGWYTPTWATG